MSTDLRDIDGAWDHSLLGPAIEVGEGCVLARRASFAGVRSAARAAVRLGARVHVHTWCAFNVEPEGRVAVGDDTTLVGAVVMCAERIEIGRGVLVSYNVTLADSDFHPLAVDARRRDAEACAPEGDRSGRPRLESAPVVVEDGAALGVGAIVLKGVVVGAGARVMAGAVVTHSVPPGAAVEGNPARPVSPGARGMGAA